MSKILQMMDEQEAAESFEVAYRHAVIDYYSSIGCAQDAIKWLWADVKAAQQGE